MGNSQRDNRSYIAHIASDSGLEYNKDNTPKSKRNREIRDNAISAFDRMTMRNKNT